MPQQRPNPCSGWTSYEVAEKHEKLGGIGLISREFAARPDGIDAAIAKMKLVQTIGWPDAARNLRDKKGRRLVVKKDDIVWLLAGVAPQPGTKQARTAAKIFRAARPVQRIGRGPGEAQRRHGANGAPGSARA